MYKFLGILILVVFVLLLALVLCLMVIGASMYQSQLARRLRTVDWLRPFRARLIARQSERQRLSAERAEQEFRRTDPLGALAADLQRSRRARQQACDDILVEVGDALGQTSTDVDGDQFMFRALDAWNGREFSERPVRDATFIERYSPALKPLEWFRSEPEPSTPEVESHARRLLMTSEERAAVDVMRTDRTGALAYAAARLASRTSSYNCWSTDFFDTYGVRVDLDDEVTSISRRAADIAHRIAVLGPPPDGELRDDLEVAEAYCSRAQLLNQQLDVHMERLMAFATYEQGVAQVEIGVRKQQQLHRINGVEGHETDAVTVDDRMRAERMRMSARESAILAEGYLGTIELQVAELQRLARP
ncbi:hypothetical protein [Williamsia sterculiae]|uniref:Uncharacterized protein n=1 Tax=Williamsia sterculiae TaxID=1344003 RepID=A0A1N7HB82_9NOCA|nr:hypothetical protein [Williamsia sterculiae]SIS22001.1 hypothetical protein SAMN05445060_3863 [Williamsia sterculiae]